MCTFRNFSNLPSAVFFFPGAIPLAAVRHTLPFAAPAQDAAAVASASAISTVLSPPLLLDLLSHSRLEIRLAAVKCATSARLGSHAAAGLRAVLEQQGVVATRRTLVLLTGIETRAPALARQRRLLTLLEP